MFLSLTHHYTLTHQWKQRYHASLWTNHQEQLGLNVLLKDTLTFGLGLALPSEGTNTLCLTTHFM